MRHRIPFILLASLSALSLHCLGDADPTDDEIAPEEIDNESEALKTPEKPLNFRPVTAGVLYAGAHPYKNEIEWLVEKKKIKSILSVQDRYEEALWPIKGRNGKFRFDLCLPYPDPYCERRHASQEGIHHEHFFNRSWRVVIPKEVKDEDYIQGLMKILGDKANQPVYVHCAYGLDRTSGVVALFRVLQEDWTAKEAFREWRSMRPQVCTSMGVSAKTFEGEMDRLYSRTHEARYQFDKDTECAKPAPPKSSLTDTPPATSKDHG